MDDLSAPKALPAGMLPRQAMIALLPELRGFARFLVRDRSEADDLVQEALVRALAASRQFQPGTNFKAWMFAILRNTFFEQSRRRRTERAALDRAPPREDVASADDDGRAALADFQQQLWRLTPTLREALVLVGVQELSYDEAAVICKVPVGTVKARVSRARTQLKHLMGHCPPEHDDDRSPRP